MGRKLVAIHFMHEREKAAAEAAVEKVESGDAFVVGRTPEEGIEHLRKQGLVVEVLGDIPDPAPGAPARAPPPFGLTTPTPLTGPQRFRVKLEGPMLQGFRQQVEGLKGKILRRVKGDEVEVRVDAADADALAGLPFVASVEPAGAAARRAPPRAMARGMPGAPPPPPAAPGAPGAPAGRAFDAGAVAAPKPFTADVRLGEQGDVASVKAWLQARGHRVVAAKSRKLRVELAGGEDALGDLRANPDVEHAEEYLPKEKFNDVAKQLLGVEDAAGTRLMPFTGAGEIVAVADTGIDDVHPDFEDQIVAKIALGRAGKTDDPDGHGTHVAGSIAATGAASGGRWGGVAPRAKLVLQSLLDANGGLDGLPLDLSDLFEEAYLRGARIHNDSWGANAAGRYTVDSLEVDEFVAGRRDMLVVIAAGNAGIASRPQYREAGIVDLESMGAPATAKNALVVGASRSARTQGGYAARTYGACWGAHFPPGDGVGAETVSGDPERLAAFSSRGFFHERRTKPDVVAPGTDILSTRSRAARLASYWGPCETSDDYAFMGGTSMAAPLVSGCAALVREYYRTVEDHPTPSAALLKATVINGTRWLRGPDAILGRDAPPNNDQGFGRVHMPTTIPNPSEPSLRLAFLDTWQTPALQFTNTNQSFRFQLDVQAGRPLRVCLAFTDAPGPGLQNDLNVTLEEPQGTKKWLGNGVFTGIDYPVPDRSNNVEIVRVEEPVAGRWLIRVSSWNVINPPQDFALVVTGALASGLVRV